jgi:hypothetical protein
MNAPAPALPSGQNRAGIRAAMTHLVDKLAATATVTEVAAEAETLTPNAPGWCVEMYDTIVTVWPEQSLSRRTFERLWPGGTGKRLWQKYVNGSGNLHSQKGLWATWNIIDQTGPRSTWEWTQPLDIIFSLDADLHRYASEMAALVQHSPTGPVSPSGPAQNTGQTGPDRTNQTREVA